MGQINPDRKTAQRLDRKDPLGEFCQHFCFTGDGIYMLGNSLGLMSQHSKEAVGRVLSEWEHMAIGGWTEAEMPWFHMAEHLGALQAPLVGAYEDEVVVMNSTTVNLHALLGTFLPACDSGKSEIVADELNFPSDIYALQSHAGESYEMVLVQSDDGYTLTEDRILEALSDDTAAVILCSVLYQSGQYLDMKYLTDRVHRRGALIGFDLSHSAGVIPHRLHEWGVDFAFWCTYKYLNGGPGSPASIFVNRRHFDRKPRLAGWWGSDKERQFDMSLEFAPAEGAGRWQIGTPHVLSMASLEGSLQIFNETTIDEVREKSLLLTEYMMQLIDCHVPSRGCGVRVVTPRQDSRRGGHVAVECDEAWRICQALHKRGVIADYRAPRIVRFAPSPLYTSFEQVWQVVSALKQVIERREYLQFSSEKGSIT